MFQEIFKNLIIPFRDFIYPPICLTCDSLVEQNHHRVCTECWESFMRLDPSYPTWREIRERFRSDGIVSDVVSCFLFQKDGKLQEVIHYLKYGGMKSLGVRLGGELGARIKNNERFARADCVVPVPLHRLKQRERGYNQSELICRGVATITRLPVASSLLKRRTFTQTQTRLDLAERRENVSDAFTLDSKQRREVKGKTLIVVDDVITTGSTINACAVQLLDAGAAEVLAASVALAQ